MVLVVAVVGSHSGHSSRSGIDGHGSYDGGSSRMKVAATFATILIASTKNISLRWLLGCKFIGNGD